ncbi:Uncharacterised protein [Acinetobacter baumannii]|nr:Uncharacterised protein [Acinetobacter baumannii]
MSSIRSWRTSASTCLFNCSSSKDRREIGVRNSWDTALVSSRWLLIRLSMRSAIWLKCWARVRMSERRKMRVRDDRSPSPKRCAARRRVSRSRQCGRTHTSRAMPTSTPSRM